MEKINQLLNSFIEEYQIQNIKEFWFPSRLSQIIYNHKKEIAYPYKLSQVPIEQSLKYSIDFLSIIKEKYIMEFDQNKNEFIFEKNSDENAYSDYDYEKNKKIIYIPYNNNLQDSFVITHEVVHATTMQPCISIARNVFSEVFSFWSEMLQKDYFKSKNIKNYFINDVRQIVSLMDVNCINIFQTMLVYEYLDRGYISFSSFMEMLNTFPLDEIEVINNHLSKNLDENYFDILFQNRYVIGYPIACYLYDRLTQSDFCILNDSINEYSILDFLDYIELDYKDDDYVDLTEDSYQKIEESYIKKLKMIR